MTHERQADKTGPAAVLSLVQPAGPPSGPGETQGSWRREKAARLRAQIRRGTYYVSSLAVARAILAKCIFPYDGEGEKRGG